MLLANRTGRKPGPVRQACMLLLSKGGNGTVTKGTNNCRHAAEKNWAKGRLTAWVVNFKHALR